MVESPGEIATQTLSERSPSFIPLKTYSKSSNKENLFDNQTTDGTEPLQTIRQTSEINVNDNDNEDSVMANEKHFDALR